MYIGNYILIAPDLHVPIDESHEALTVSYTTFADIDHAAETKTKMENL